MRKAAIRLTVPGALVAALIVGYVSAGPSQARAAGVSDEPHITGPLTIQSVPNGRPADLSGGHIAEGRRIQEWTYNGSAAQQWWLQRSGAHYKIKSNINGAYCMARQRDGDLAPVVLRRCDVTQADWDFQRLGGERYRIKDPAGAFYLHVWNETPTDGRGLVTSANDQIGAQWYLTDLVVPRRPMPSDPRLDQVTFMTAHNAMANTDEGFWGRFPNQSYRLRSQLDQGVRGLRCADVPRRLLGQRAHLHRGPAGRREFPERQPHGGGHAVPGGLHHTGRAAGLDEPGRRARRRDLLPGPRRRP
jgi:chitinase